MKLDSWGTVASGNCNVSPSVDTDDTIYIATGDGGNGKLFAVNPDGSKKWITFNDPVNVFWNKGNAANPKMRPVTPAFDDKYVYCGNGGSTGSLITVDKTTGNRVKYLTNEDGTSGPAGGVYSGPIISKQGMMFVMCTNYGMFGVSHQEMAKNDNTFTPWAWNIFNGELGSGCHASMALDKDGNVYGLIYGKDLTTKVYCAQADGSVKQSILVSLSSKYVNGLAEDGWPMRSKDAQHSSCMK